MLDPLKIQLWKIVSGLMWVLGIKLRSPVSTHRFLTTEDLISPLIFHLLPLCVYVLVCVYEFRYPLSPEEYVQPLELVLQEVVSYPM